MPRLIPHHSVVVSRPHKDKRKDKEGNPIHVRQTVPMGEPFDFTADEVDDLKASGHEFSFHREGDTKGEPSFIGDAEDVDRAAAEAAAMAAGTKGAALDAANTARAGAKGQAKPPVAKSGTADSALNAPGAGETDDEEL